MQLACNPRAACMQPTASSTVWRCAQSAHPSTCAGLGSGGRAPGLPEQARRAPNRRKERPAAQQPRCAQHQLLFPRPRRRGGRGGKDGGRMGECAVCTAHVHSGLPSRLTDWQGLPLGPSTQPLHPLPSYHRRRRTLIVQKLMDSSLAAAMPREYTAATALMTYVMAKPSSRRARYSSGTSVSGKPG